MPISSCVLTLCGDDAERAEALQAIEAHDAIDVGRAVANRVPIVIETATSEDDRDVWEWLHSLAGIAMVEVAFVHFDADESNAAAGPAPTTEGNAL